MLLVGSRFKNYNSVNEYENVTYYDSLKKLGMVFRALWLKLNFSLDTNTIDISLQKLEL